MRQAVAAALASSVTRYTCRWKLVISPKRAWNGTASRKANSTCTPGSATRSSLSSSRSWRLSCSCSSSSRRGGSAIRGRVTRLAASLTFGRCAQSRQRLADQPRDLHLRDADALPDLGLRHVLDKAQAQHLALARADDLHEPVERRAVLGEPESGVDQSDGVAERVARVLVAARARRIERGGAVRAGRLERLEDLLLVGTHALGDLADRRGAVALSGQVGDRPVDAQGELLEVAWDPYRPGPVTEMALELAQDRRDGVAGEGDVAIGVEAVDRLDEPERRDLEEVLERLLGALVAARELARQRQEALDERLARGGVALALLAQKELAILSGPLRPAGGGVAHVSDRSDASHRSGAHESPHRTTGTRRGPR